MNETPASNRISLCIIFGNEETLIERCLNSFDGAFDEICAVRAVGKSEPDKTWEKIQEWAITHAKFCNIGEYKNSRVGADRPHVDDFGAARNMSFDLAKSPWLLWCDCDDILSPDGARWIRGAAKDGAHSCYGFFYEISPVRVAPRERLVRREMWQWQNPVHEALAQVGHKEIINMVEGATWIHRPTGPKMDSFERNLWILENKTPAGLAWFAHYYISVEYFARGKREKALKHASIALADDRMPQAYRYELTLNMAKMAEVPHERGQWAHQAYMIDPRRREALAFLCMNCLETGDPSGAIAFSKSMNAQPELPVAQRPMNHEPPYYGWIGRQLTSRSIRAYGHLVAATAKPGDSAFKQIPQIFAAALKVETDEFIKANGKISLLHATRGRADQSQMCRAHWFWQAKNAVGVEHIFAIDDDDEKSLHMVKTLGYRFITVPPGGGSVAAWNAAAQIALGDVLIQLSDDFMCPEGWDAQILARIGDTSKPAVLAVSDGVRPDGLLCIAIATKARVALQEGGTLFWHEYKSLCSDDEFTVRALVDGVVINAKDLLFRHAHPIAQGIPRDQWDATYQQSNTEERQKEGYAIFSRRNQGQLDQLKAIQCAMKGNLKIVLEEAK